MVYAKLKSALENETQKLIWDFSIQMDHLIRLYLKKTTRPIDNQRKKKRSCRIVNFTVPTDDRIKLKESEKKDKYLDFILELKKLWDILFTQPLRSGRIWHKVNF